MRIPWRRFRQLLRKAGYKQRINSGSQNHEVYNHPDGDVVSIPRRSKYEYAPDDLVKQIRRRRTSVKRRD